MVCHHERGNNFSNEQILCFHHAAKLRVDLREGIPFWVNEQQDLITWKKPPEMRSYLYAEAKELFDRQKWDAAASIFEEILHLGHGKDWHYTKKYMDICKRHLKNHKDKYDATQVYNDAKHLCEMGSYAEGEIALNFVVEILQLGPKENFHHTREYLAKCKHMLRKESDYNQLLAQEEGNIEESDKQKLSHYYSIRYGLGVQSKVSASIRTISDDYPHTLIFCAS